MGKNSNNNNKNDRWFQILLIIVGFLLGTSGTYFWQWKEINFKRHTIAKVIYAGVQREIKTSELLIDTLKAEKIKPGQLAPHGFKFLHDPTIYLSVANDIGMLEEDVIIAIDAYFRSMKGCQAMRDFMREGLEVVNEDVFLASDYINAYIKQLENFIETGKATIDVINDRYPQKYMGSIRKEFLPKVEVFNMKLKQ